MVCNSRKSQLKEITASRLSKRRAEQDEPPTSLAPEVPKRRRKTRHTPHDDPVNNEVQALNAQIKNLERDLQSAQAELQALSKEVQQKNSQCADFRKMVDQHEIRSNERSLELKASHDTLFMTLERVKVLQKRVRRLEREKTAKGILYRQQVKENEKANTFATKIFSDLELFTAGAEKRLSEVQNTNQQQSEKEQRTSRKLRLKVKQLDSQRRRAQDSLRTSQIQLKALKTFKSTKEGIFTPEMRELGRKLHSLGCSAENVGDAIKTCADAFGISVTKLPSRRSVLRFRDEGGLYGLIQLGREIAHTDRKGECSDGTTDRKTTYESHHVTYKCPTYLPGVDDTDSSTWTHQTRFVTVEPAVDHTGKTQFEGTQHLAAQIAAAYSDSPLAKKDGKTMSANDWIRKEEFQNMDHAADGKKKLEFCMKWKKEVLTEDLGNDLLDFLETGELHSRLASLSEEDLAKATADATSLSDSQAEVDRETARKVLACALGEGALEVMPAAHRDVMLAITFAGCCAHKDLNAFKYGVSALEEMWEKEGKTPPVLLANKANASTIRLGDPDSAAVRAAETSSTRGGVKTTMLAGALFNHSDDKKGYQDLFRRFMTYNKKLIYDVVDNSRFADTSNTRFQSNTYGAADMITHLPLYHELMEEVTDGKVKPGFNHLESNLYRALHDIPTLTELAAITLYGVAISWPYLRIVRGDGSEAVRNVLDDDLIELHRKIPAFCESIAEDPNRLLQEPSSTDFATVTLDGRPWMDPSAVMAIRILASELPDLKSAISAIFSGVTKGWRQFTQEFVPGGPFDLLTPEQRSELFIPATNDVNEGALGSWRVSRRSNPNITAASFSNKTRYERNNTDRFIAKLCDDADHRYVRQEVRRIGASGESARLQENLLEAQRKRAEANRLKKSEAARKKREELERLSQVGLMMDRDIILRMTVIQLKDQIKIHKQILADPVHGKTLQKDLKTKAVLQTAVLAAVERNKDQIEAFYRAISTQQNQEPIPDASELDRMDQDAQEAENDNEDDIDEDDYF